MVLLGEVPRGSVSSIPSLAPTYAVKGGQISVRQGGYMGVLDSIRFQRQVAAILNRTAKRIGRPELRIKAYGSLPLSKLVPAISETVEKFKKL